MPTTAQLLHWYEQLATIEFWQNALSVFEGLGPAAPILLSMVESIIPALPLVAIVALNIAAHGMLPGFLYSWVGTCLGSTVMFMFWRRVVRRFFWRFAHRSARIQKAGAWVTGFDRSTLLLLAMLPFTPSSFLNLAFGISDFDEKSYLTTIFTGKLVMTALLGIFGQSLVNALRQPLWLLLSAALIGGLYLASRHFNNKSGL